MIAKLITYGKDRTEAIDKMVRAIDEYKISGIETTLQFCKFVMKHEAFISGNFDTRFIGLYFTPEKLDEMENKDEEIIAAVLATHLLNHKKMVNSSASTVGVALQESSWKANRLNYR
jgi:propionyl-CoA carboxylase alpha chain